MVGTELAVPFTLESVLFSLLKLDLDLRRMSLKKAGAMIACVFCSQLCILAWKYVSQPQW